MVAPTDSIPVGAAALFNLLTALFTYIDEQVEPRNLRVITVNKMRWVAERVGMQAEFAASLSLAPEVLADTYSDLECQYFIIPSKMNVAGGDSEFDYGFEEPDAPGLTKPGFVKMQALGLILEADPGPGSGNMQYRFLQNCITTFPLTRVTPSPTGGPPNILTFPPLPPQQVINHYVTTLAQTLLGITDPTPAGIRARVSARRASAAAGQRPAPASDGQFQAQVEALKAQEQRNMLSHMTSQMATNQIRRAMETQDRLSGWDTSGTTKRDTFYM